MIWSFTTMAFVFFSATMTALIVLMLAHMDHQRKSKAKREQARLKAAVKAGVDAFQE